MNTRLKKSFDTTFQQFIYTDGETLGYNYIVLARMCKTLTFDKRFLKRNFRSLTDTPFKEIRWATNEEVCDEKFLHLLKNPPEYEGSFDSFLDTLKEAMKSGIREMWNPEGKYLILHSSGYDSRIISMSLAELRDEGFPLGEIHFRCHQPECPQFFKIMQIEGWDKSQYSCFPGKPGNHYDIGVRDISTNGFVEYFQQMNFWSDIIPFKEEKDWYNVNGWEGGLFKYIALSKPEDDKIDAVKNQQPGSERYWAWQGQWIGRFRDMIQPFRSYKYLDAALRVRWEWCKALSAETDNMRIALQDKFKYDLSSVPRGTHAYDLTIDRERMGHMKKWYRWSKFYRKYRIRINPFIFYDGGKGIPARCHWDARLWGFAVTVYDQIFKLRKHE